MRRSFGTLLDSAIVQRITSENESILFFDEQKKVKEKEMSDSKTFSLFLYSLPNGELVRESPSQDTLCDWLGRYCDVSGPPFEFQPGQCFKAFAIIFDLVQIDLLQLVGSSVMEGGENEEMYCAGSMSIESVRIFLGLGRGVLYQRRDAATVLCRERAIDPDWFFLFLSELIQQLEKCLEGHGVMGYFE